MNRKKYKAIRHTIGTQEQVAKKLGIHRVTLAKRETGKLGISPEAAGAMLELERKMNQKATCAKL